MNLGELNKRITIETLTTVINENGFEEEQWVLWKTVWAKVQNLYGREFFQASAVQQEKTVKFTIRYLKDINERMRIKFQGKQYNITFIDNIRYENKYMEIKGLEVS